MYSRMEKNHGQKVQRFSIRKYSFGAASVAVAAYMMFGGAATVQADAQVTPKTASDSQTVPDESNQADSTMPLASTGTATPTAEQPSTPAPAATQPTAPTETPKAEEALAPASKADTSKLEAAIARMEAALEKAGLTEKTASAIEVAKAELAKAQALLSNDKATQKEVDFSTSSLKNRAFVLESMPKASADKKEEKENKNQDSRNGKAIPGHGESGFRDAAPATGYKNDINTVNAELKAAIDKVKVEITKEEALGEGKTNKEKLDVLRAIVAKAEEEKTKATTAAAKADATEQELQAALTEAKQEKDRLNYYLNNAENWGAPINNNRAGYGNNPANGVFESMSNGFGAVDFSGPAVESKSKTIEDQVNNLQSEKHYGKVTYNWKTKKITAAEAEAGALNGWKIGGAKDYVNAVKPEAPTDYTVAGDRTEAPKPAKAYDDNGKHDASTATQNQPNADGKFLGGAITLDGMKNDDRGNVKDRDYYLELGSKGVTLSKEYDVNPNSELFFNMVYNGAYGKAALSSQGEELSVEITDAYTGKKIASIPMRDGSTPTEATGRPAGSNEGTPSDSWNNIARIYHVPEGTSKVKVTIKAKDDGDFKGVQDGFIIGGVGIATGPGMQLTTNVTSEGKSGEYGFTKDKLYKRSQEGKLNLELKNVGGVENTFPYGGTFNIKVQIPKGVKLGTVDTTNYKKLDLSKANGESIWTDQGYLTNVRYDEATNTLSMDVNAVQYGKNNLKAAGETSKKFSIPFTTEDDYVGDATFKVTGTGGMGTQDAEGNRIYPWLWTGDKGPYAYDGNYKANGLRWTDNPDYYYNRTIYIDARKPKSATVEEVHTDSIVGDSDAKNQEKYLLVNTGDAPGSLTPSDDEIKANLKKVADNNGVTLSDEETAKRIAEIKKALQIENEIGKKIKITLPNNDIIELEKKDDGWYQGDTKVETTPEGKLKVSLKDVSLHTHEGNEKIAATSVSPVGNVSEPSYANIVNEAPKVEAKKDIYVYKTKAADKWNADKVVEVAKPTATDLEDDRDGDETTKPTIAVSNDGGLDTTTVGDYTVKVQSTDSEGKKSTEAEVTVHVLDLITVDPTVTTDPTNPSTTAPVSPKTADTPVKEGDENLGKYPAGVTREDLVKEVTRTIKYLKEEDANKDDATPLYAEKVQKVTYKRTATVNPQTGDVTYSDWQVYNEADKLTDATADGTKGKFNAVDSPVVENYLLVKEADKTVAEKEAPVPAQDGTVTPEVTKVLYKEIGSFTPEYPEGKKPTNAPEKIKYPNNPNDPTKPGDFSKVTIPYVEGYVPTYNGVELTPVDPADPSKGYKVPDNFDPTDKFGKTPIQYAPGIQKATVKFVSVDKDGKETPLDEKFNITDLSGKAGTKIPEDKIQARLDVLRSMGYTVKENPFDQDPTFDSDSDKDQNFTIKLTPKVSTPTPVYVVEGDKPTAGKLKDAVTTEGNDKTVDETKIPETKGKVGDDTLTVPVTVTYGSGDNKREETVNVPVKVVKGYPQLVAVSEDKKQPSPEDNIDTSDYPDDATYEYKEEVDTTAPGDKKVTVVVKQGDKVLVEVPATVRVVDSKPQFVVADPKKPQPDVKASITPDEYPTGTEFEYKEPVDTTTAGEKEVTVVAKLDGKTIVEVPAKVMVVDPKTQYVFEDPAKSQPSADESIDPDQYPEGTKFTYKDGEVDTTTPGDKKVTVVAKDGEDKLVEVPAVVKVLPLVKPEGLTVLKGSENLEAAVKAKAEEVVAALPKDKLPEGVTVKVKEVKAGTTPTTAEVTETGKPKPATVVVEYTDDKGNVIGTKEVEVPVTVVGSTPKSVVVFEGTTPEKDKVKESVTPGQGGTVGEPTTLPETAGKAGATDVTVEVPVTYPGMKEPEKVKVPVTVLPVAKADVTVTKGTTPDKLKELAKAKADEAIKAKDFTDKLPKGATVTVGDITKAIEEKVTANKGTGVTTVEVPVTYTVDGKDYTTTIPVKVNVKGSDIKPVYVVEGDKPKADDVNKAITPDTDGTKTPVTDEDINKAIPTTEGKVGAKDVKVTAKVTYKDGGEEVVTVPVTVLPKVSPKGVVVPKDTDKGTLEKAVADKVKESAENTKGLPEGVTVTVKETPLTTPGTETAGEKDSVTVTVEYKDKDGNIIATKEVKVPVIVTPKVTPVVVEVGTPVTAEDVKKHVDLPKDWEITNVGEIPATTTPGEKPTVPVEVKLPNGKTVTVKVPVIVTPKVTPIEVEVGTPITKDDVKKHIELPKEEGWEIIEDNWVIPTTETAGKKSGVKVKVKLPTGEIVELEVPVTVTPKRGSDSQPNNGGGNGGNNYRPTPTPQNVPSRPTAPDQPVTPTEPGQSAAPNQTQPAAPAQADATVATDTAAKPATPKYVDGQKELPNTGTEANASLAALGLLGALGGFGLLSRKKKED
ncbi:YSIRK-type signal peptide-containing protein [Streptococcus mitis]|uniref:YSIRK-type signal peptide-containing protein n=1 Tax=Streptococcus mitis TaxID=28037 RepID=A0A6I1UCJ3_STRMT|nr:Rib/alpha-like domain-containing protein [Streptococcus mitis]MQP82306.1 YSIRK-type signal peptide-containing protein [Streptococcus mitis]MQQ40168.1 YSIRK-type signal peptide-containing protein [Streptococcus mitis]MQQ61194.1 YSIRK-type signal peptide-containing protein [Streptococcus mitis]